MNPCRAAAAAAVAIMNEDILPARSFPRDVQRLACEIIKNMGISQLMISDFTCFMEEVAEDRLWFYEDFVTETDIGRYFKAFKENRLHELDTPPFLAVCRMLHICPFLLVSPEIRLRWYEQVGLHNYTGIATKIETMVSNNQEFYDRMYTNEEMRETARTAKKSFHAIRL